jgi:type II/III secretion system protein
MVIRLLVGSLLFLLFLSDNCLGETEIFKIRNRRAEEVLPVVEALLSPQGKAVADKFGNTIVVNDTPEVIAEVQTLLLSSDQRVPQVRVQVAFDSADSGRTIGFGQRETRPGRHLSTEDTRSRYSNSNRKGSGRSFITVSSGSTGYIRMAREVPVTERWIFFCRRYGVPYLLKETRTIETGMEVSPVAAGDMVIVTVTPRISWMENGRTDSFRFVDASTTVTIPRSQWFDLGGMSNISERNKDILGTILSTGDSSEESSFLMQIKADVNN